MAVRVNLAASGIVGVTKLNASSVNANTTIAVNTVLNADSTTANLTVTVPAETAGEDWRGSVIIIKNTGANDVTITGAAGVLLDGVAWTDQTLNEDEVFQAYYINETYGWMLTYKTP